MQWTVWQNVFSLFEMWSQLQCISLQSSEWLVQATDNLYVSLGITVMNTGFLAGSLLTAYYVTKGRFTAGDYIMYASYVMQLYEPLNMFGAYYRYIVIHDVLATICSSNGSVPSGNKLPARWDRFPARWHTSLYYWYRIYLIWHCINSFLYIIRNEYRYIFTDYSSSHLLIWNICSICLKRSQR